MIQFQTLDRNSTDNPNEVRTVRQGDQRAQWATSDGGTRYVIERGGTMRQVCVYDGERIIAVAGWVDYCGVKPIAEQAVELVAAWEWEQRAKALAS